jgi:hypothetical protein
MKFRGQTKSGYEPSAGDIVLADGRVIGPFESEHSKQLFDIYFAGRHGRLRSVREVFEGTVTGDDYELVSDDEFALETHPFGTVYDIWTKADNGSAVFETANGFSVVDPDRLVFVSNPEPGPSVRRLCSPRPAPAVFDVDPGDAALLVVPSAHHGEIAVFRHEVGEFVVAWRRDGRQTRELRGLSLHDHLATAAKRAGFLAAEFAPTERKRKNRARDTQRESLYNWEHSFKRDRRGFEGIEEAQALADAICADLGCPSVTVSFGRSDLDGYSYHSGLKGIVLSRSMLDNHTVVHEVAHHIHKRMRGLPKEPAHGPQFAGVFLALLEHYMGASTEDALLRAVDHGVVVDIDIMSKVSSRIVSLREASGSRRPTP